MTVLLILAAYIIVAASWAAALLPLGSPRGDIFGTGRSGYLGIAIIAVFWPIAAPIGLVVAAVTCSRRSHGEDSDD